MAEPLLVLNPEDLDRELKKIAAYANHPEAGKWFMTVAKEHILNLDGADRDENFVRYDPELLRPGRYDGMPDPSTLPASMIADLCRGVEITVSDPAAIQSTPFVMPPWAEEALREGKTPWLFDSVQVRRRKVWEGIERILDWFNSAVMADANYAQLSFQRADRTANRWREEVDKRYDPNNVPAKKPEGTMASAKCPKCGHEFQYPYNRYRACIAISCPKCFELILLNFEAS
jgi:ribosomal protein S27E